MIFNFPNPNRKIWRDAITSFGILFLLIVFLFWSTFSGMVSIWARSETFTHGFLVFPIVVWLIWRKRNLIFSKIPKPNYLFLIPIVFVSLVWLLGDLVSINSVTQLAATALLVLLVLTVFGWSVASVILFPLAFLFFSVPLGEFLLPILMEWTAKFTVVAIRLSGIPVYQEGLQFVISSGNWSVVEACSGVRYLISSVMIGTLYAYLNYQSLNRRLVFIGVSIVVPVLANWMRAYLIVMLGHFSGNTLAVGFDHLIYGWLFFGVVIMLMFLIGSRWTESTSVDESKFELEKFHDNFSSKYFAVTVFLVAVAVSVPVGWGYFILKKNNLKIPHLIAPNNFNSGWKQTNGNLVSLKPNFHGSFANASGNYEKNSQFVGLYAAYYRNQDYHNKLVNSENSIFSSKNKDWLSVGAGNYVLKKMVDPISVRVMNWKGMDVSDQKNNIRLQTWQFYWVNGIFTDSDYKAKIYGAIQRLVGKGDDSAIVVLYANDDGDNSAKKSMEEFLQDNYSEIKNMLEMTRGE
nr:exosortase A [uncultured Albidiferax sp.]